MCVELAAPSTNTSPPQAARWWCLEMAGTTPRRLSPPSSAWPRPTASARCRAHSPALGHTTCRQLRTCLLCVRPPPLLAVQAPNATAPGISPAGRPRWTWCPDRGQHRGPGGGAAGASARKCAERLACRSSACCTCSTVSSSREPLAAARRPPVCRRDASGRSPAAKQGGRACSRPNDVLTDALAGGTPALHNACLA